MININVDFNKNIGKIKPVHGVGQPPITGVSTKYFNYLSEANIPYSRLHDVGGWFGKNMFVDIPNVFRDFDADENDPASYDFAFTDILIEGLIRHNCMPIYRLGVTIENFHNIKLSKALKRSWRCGIMGKIVQLQRLRKPLQNKGTACV